MSFSKTFVKYVYDKLPNWSIEIYTHKLSTGDIFYSADVYCVDCRQATEDFESEDEALKWAKKWMEIVVNGNVV